MSRKRPQPPVKPFKKKPNPLKAAKVTEIDYKDVALLRKFISDRGKIRSRRWRRAWPTSSGRSGRPRSCLP